MTGALTITGLEGLPDLVVSPGESLALLGEPGSGKTDALLRIAGKRPSDGVVRLDGNPLAATDVGLLRQEVALLPELTAAENVALTGFARRDARDRRRVEAVLESLRLPPATWYNLAEELSGGQQQRVGIARALVAAPPVLCLDEPFTELDGATLEAVWAALRQERNGGAILVLTTTDPSTAVRCDQQAALSS